jgi:hypothetical protein
VLSGCVECREEDKERMLRVYAAMPSLGQPLSARTVHVVVRALVGLKVSCGVYRSSLDI